MADQKELLALMRRMRASAPLTASDEAIVRRMAVRKREEREEADLQRQEPTSAEEFISRDAIPVFHTSEAGLQTFGWRDIPLPAEADPSLRAKIAFRMTERELPLESRHVCLVKYLDWKEYRKAWAETQVLKGCIHENIADWFGTFAKVRTVPCPEEDPSLLPVRMLYLLTEFPSAGSLAIEVPRYRPAPGIPESGSLFYALQVASALAYLHAKGIIHNRLTADHVLLKFNADLSKTCIVGGFGDATLLQEPTDGNFEPDVQSLCSLVFTMMGGASATSSSIAPVLAIGRKQAPAPASVILLLEMEWFRTTAKAPRPPVAAESTAKKASPSASGRKRNRGSRSPSSGKGGSKK